MNYDKDGWLFQTPDYKPNNNIHLLSEADLADLYQASLEDEAWAQNVRNEVLYRDKNPSVKGDYIIDEFRIMNTGGTVIQYPFGYIITFPAKRHLFRGENQIYEESVPSLNRKIKDMDSIGQELCRVVSNMRIEQFARFIWQFNIVPYWEAKLCDVNFMALAQHYGFDTHLLDLTNDFMTALFFATCYYDQEAERYLPLTDDKINSSEETKYGMIFHAPDWTIDFLQPGGSMRWYAYHMDDNRNEPYLLDSGDLDGMAFQIGFQPLHRCHFQNGYIFPMRNASSLQQNTSFEKLRFRQSAELSKKVYEYMDQGRKVFPQEGITKVMPVLQKIQESVIFSESDLEAAYYRCNKRMFPSKDKLESALTDFDIGEGKISFTDNEIEYPITSELKDAINSHYDGVNLFKAIGGMFHQHPDDREYRKQRCIQIYGEEI